MQFLHPNVFYILMIPLVLLFILLLTSKSGIHKYFSAEVLEKLSVKSGFLDKKSRNFLYFLVLFFFIVALSRPVVDKKEQNIKQTLIPIVIALDVSKSMLAQDIFPNRIELAKKKLQQIIEISKNSTIGVVLFAKDSFILSPVTEDFLSLKYIVNNLDTNLNFANGSNIDAVLEATKYMLEDFQVKNLIILSDGGNDNSYEKEIEFAKENNIVVYSIGLATKQGAPIPNTTGEQKGYLTNKNGDIVTVKLNESIKEFSLKSNGGYIDFTLDDSDVKAIVNQINIESQKEELNTQKIKIYTELFYYPLALGLFLLLIALSSFPSFSLRNNVKKKNSKHNSIKVNVIIGFVFISSIFLPNKIYAFDFNFENIKKANEAYENKEYSKASDAYRQVTTNAQSLYNLANSLYKEKKYDDAIKTYNEVVTQDTNLEQKKLYNIGNSYVQKGELEKAKQMYEKALKIKDDKDTVENLEIVKKELEKKKKQKQKDQEQNTNQDNQSNKNNEQNNHQNNNEKSNKQDKQNKNQSNQNENKQDTQSNKSENKENQNLENQEEKDKQDLQKSKEDSYKNFEKNKEQNQTKKNQEALEEQKAKDKMEEQMMQSRLNEEKRKEQILSTQEEKKWMKLLQNQKTPIYLQKVESQSYKESSNEPEQPW